jgi:RNA polymerase sigma factor (sigma-70 family)
MLYEAFSMEEISITQTLDHLFRHEYSKLVALLTNKYSASNIDLVEDAVQEALYKAAKIWPYKVTPDNPSAWLYRVASNHLIDQLRKENKSVDWEDNEMEIGEESMLEIDEESIKDEQLKMIFACCHPSMKTQEQLMLSLKLLCGLSVKEIARALLKNEEATKKAITRAKLKFKNEVGDLAVPSGDDLKSRLEAVLQVIYLLFNEGYKATEGEKLIKNDLSEEAIRMAMLMLNEEACKTGELYAMISMMLFKAARFPARADENGKLLTLEFQDRALWRKDYIEYGWKFLKKSSLFPGRTVYQIEAAIASYYSNATTYGETNWKQILALYDVLIEYKPSPVVKMSRVLVMSKVNGPESALQELQVIEKEIKGNQSFEALKADLYAETKNWDKARLHLTVATGQAQNLTERRFLEEKLQRWKDN